jgi:hypothetical protein
VLSILLDAVVQLQRRGTMGGTAAAQWVRGDEGAGEATISFRAVCESLQIDAVGLARGLLRGVEPSRLKSRVLPPKRHPARRRGLDIGLQNRPLLFLWVTLIAALTRGPWALRVVVGATLMCTVVGVGCLVAP